MLPAGGGSWDISYLLPPLTQIYLVFFLSALLGLLSNVVHTEVVPLNRITGIPIPDQDITVPP